MAEICCLCDFKATSRSSLEEHIFEEHPQIFRGKMNDINTKTLKDLEMDKSDLNIKTGNCEDDQPDILVTDIKIDPTSNLESLEVEFPLKGVEQVRCRLFEIDSIVKNDSKFPNKIVRDMIVNARSNKISKKIEVELSLETSSLENARNSAIGCSEQREIDSNMSDNTRGGNKIPTQENVKRFLEKGNFEKSNHSAFDNSELVEIDSSSMTISTRSRKKSMTIETQKNSLKSSSNLSAKNMAPKTSDDRIRFNSKMITVGKEFDPPSQKNILDQTNINNSTVENLTSNRTSEEFIIDLTMEGKKEVGRPLKKNSLEQIRDFGSYRRHIQPRTEKVTTG